MCSVSKAKPNEIKAWQQNTASSATAKLTPEQVREQGQQNIDSSATAKPTPEQVREQGQQNTDSSVTAKPTPEQAREQGQQNTDSSVTAKPTPEQIREQGQQNTASSATAKPLDFALASEPSNDPAHSPLDSTKSKSFDLYPKKLSSFALSVQKQLEDYFQKKRKNFNLPLNSTKGTQFQNSLWEALRSIPYGKTKSYGEIAQQLNRPKGARAVGQACANNPLLIVIPCHRVVSKKGIGGFALGLKAKKHLLNLEQSE